MVDARSRAIIFWACCVPSRFLIAVVAVLLEVKKVPYIARAAYAAAALVIATGFMYTYATKPRTGFGGVAFWDWARPLHSLAFALYGGLTLASVPYAYIPLFVDATFGALNWILHQT